jgi:hypothetical protein
MRIDVVEKIKISYHCRKSNPNSSAVNPVAYSFTDWTIPISPQEVSMVRYGMDMNSIKVNWMELKPFWEAYGSSAKRKTPLLKWGPEIL